MGGKIRLHILQQPRLHLGGRGEHQPRVHRQDPLLHLHHDRRHPPPQPSHRHDGRHLRQDCRDQKRVDETGGVDISVSSFFLIE